MKSAYLYVRVSTDERTKEKRLLPAGAGGQTIKIL